MVQPHEADINEVTRFYDSAQTQSDAIHFIGHLRNFDKTQDEKFLIDGLEVAMSVYDKCPFDEVELDGQLTDSPSDVMLIICLHLSELGVIPDYEE